MKLYEEVAKKIITLILQGTLKDGDKVPSIRSLSSDLGVSINTIKEAYLLLENKNYIVSKPQSGFYVKNINKKFATIESSDPLSLSPLQVSICRIYSSQLINGTSPPEAELAVSMVNSDFWPKGKMMNCYQEAIKNSSTEIFNYCLPPGYRPLREQIAIQSIKGGITTTPEEIIITSGCTEAITMALMTTCKAGDVVAIESPSYFNLLQICEELDLKIIEIPNNRETGLSLETLKFVLDYHNIKAFISIPNFNNPTGSKMSDRQKEELVQCMEDYNVPLIEDDIYSEIYYTESRPKTCKSFDKTGNVILCSSFSKNVSPGFRVGWMLPGKYYKEIEKKELLFHLGSTALPQIALSNFLKEGGYERHNRKLRELLKLQLTSMVDYIKSVFPDGTVVNMPKGGIVLWVECPREIDTHELYNRVKQRGILFAPGVIFSTSGKFKNCLRLNGGTWNNNIKEALNTIGKEAYYLLNNR